MPKKSSLLIPADCNKFFTIPSGAAMAPHPQILLLNQMFPEFDLLCLDHNLGESLQTVYGFGQKTAISQLKFVLCNTYFSQIMENLTHFFEAQC